MGLVVHHPLTTISNEEIFLDFLTILKTSLQDKNTMQNLIIIWIDSIELNL